MAVGLKEGVATLACAVVVALLVVAGNSSGYSGFGQVVLAQAQVRTHAEGARAVQRAVAATAPRVSGGDKAALKVAVSRKMAALARKDTLQLQAPVGLLTGEETAQKQALSLVPGWAGLGGHKKKKAKSTGLKVPPATSRPSPTTLNLRCPIAGNAGLRWRGAREKNLAVCGCLDGTGYHPGCNPGANIKSVSHRYYLREVAFQWELT